jgi:hypothetical protein
MYSIFIRRVDVRFGCRDCYFYCVVTFGRFDDAEVRVDFVVAFRAP